MPGWVKQQHVSRKCYCETTLTKASHFSLTCVLLSPSSERIFSFCFSIKKTDLWEMEKAHETLLMCCVISSYVYRISCNEISIGNWGKRWLLFSPSKAFSFTPRISPVTFFFPLSPTCLPSPLTSPYFLLRDIQLVSARSLVTAVYVTRHNRSTVCLVLCPK